MPHLNKIKKKNQNKNQKNKIKRKKRNRHGLRKRSDGGGRIKHDFGAVESECGPVQRMVASVANVNGNAAKFGDENGMASVALLKRKKQKKTRQKQKEKRNGFLTM